MAAADDGQTPNEEGTSSPENLSLDETFSSNTDALTLLDGLNDEQRLAVTNDSVPLAIHAGAGSGKTRALTHRIAWRSLTGRDDPGRALALTFTRKAASQLRSRLRQLGIRDQVAAGTFHSVALAQLRTWWQETGKREPELLTQKVRLVTPLLPRDHRATAALDVMGEIEWSKARRIQPEAYPLLAEEANRTPPLPSSVVARIYAEYEEAKAEKNLVDFDDLLDLCRRAMSTDKRFAAAQRWRFRHLYVDEFQDVNPLQFDLLASWLDGRPDLCAVGDPDQAIYGWNGADADYLVRFEVHFPGATVLKLRQNYRSSPQVLRAAGALVDREPMVSNRERGPEPVIEAHSDERSEARAIASRARTLREPNGRWNDQAILVRTNAQTGPIVEALRDARIPVRTRSGSGLLDRSDIKDLLNSMRHSDQDLSTLRNDLRLPATEDPVAEEADDQPSPVDTEREVAFAELSRLADEYLALEPSGNGRAFVAWVHSQSQFAIDDTADAVEVATFHAAKGLEWPTVHVSGLEQGLVPIAHVRDQGALAEERRLLYVALTRAEELLFCSWARQRSFGDRKSKRQPSPWLADLEVAIAGLERPVGRSEGARRARELADKTRPATFPDLPVIAALREFRSTAAKAADVSAFIIFNDATLADLVDRWPTDHAELLMVHGIGPTKADIHGPGILKVLNSHEKPNGPVSDSLPTPHSDNPTATPETKTEPQRTTGSSHLHQRLRDWRSEKARASGSAAYLILTNATLDALVEARPNNVDGLLAVKGIGPRKVETHGEELLELLSED
ncbi:MAG TPA: hypothetical protein DGF10_08265 [Acidimicrobiaceae bacterium]|nr:hypothetical protein [Acidimicrobiaceae bacterium]